MQNLYTLDKCFRLAVEALNMDYARDKSYNMLVEIGLIEDNSDLPF